jgi:hypothetical protein
LLAQKRRLFAAKFYDGSIGDELDRLLGSKGVWRKAGITLMAFEGG